MKQITSANFKEEVTEQILFGAFKAVTENGLEDGTATHKTAHVIEQMMAVRLIAGACSQAPIGEPSKSLGTLALGIITGLMLASGAFEPEKLPGFLDDIAIGRASGDTNPIFSAPGEA